LDNSVEVSSSADNSHNQSQRSDTSNEWYMISHLYYFLIRLPLFFFQLFFNLFESTEKGKVYIFINLSY
jgi:hypothetical protein